MRLGPLFLSLTHRTRKTSVLGRCQQCPPRLQDPTEIDNVMSSFTFLDDDPRPFSYVVDGWPLPPTRPGLTSWEDHISNLRNLEMRENDVLLLTYPRSGTHWLWEVTSMLLQGRVEYNTKSKEHHMVEYVDVDVLTSMPSPRILNTHLPFSMLPWQQIKAKKIKVLHVYRNPKDVAVSYYYFLKAMPDRPDLEFSDFVNILFSEKAIFGSYFQFLRQITMFEASNPEVPFLSLSFEDMKKDSVAGVEKLARFLDVSVTPDLCEAIASSCSFQKLQSHAHVKEEPKYYVTSGPEVAKNVKENPVFQVFRKGEVGDWKNYFTVAMNERVDSILRENMEGLPFTLQFS